MLDIKPITRKYFEDVYGHPPSRSISGFAAVVAGRAVAVAGIYYFPNQVVAFCNILPDYKQHRVSLARGTLKVLQLIKQKGIPIFAIADKNNPQAEDFLMRCGFEYHQRGAVGEVFICRP